jgi:hypothetical protein
MKKKTTPGLRRKSHLTASRRGLVVIALASVGALAAAPALAERCDGPPAPADFEDSVAKTWHFCITVIEDGAGGWTLADDRKTKDIEVPPGDKARLIFMIDRDHRPEAWLAAISIARKDGSAPPPGEFVPETEPGKDFGASKKITLNGRPRAYPVNDLNRIKADYDYEIWVGTETGGEQSVDPGIRNGGSQN